MVTVQRDYPLKVHRDGFHCCLAIFLLLSAVISLFAAAPAFAGPYVNNFGQKLDGAAGFDGAVYAQGFTTGGNTDGYALTSIQARLQVRRSLTSDEVATIRAELWSSDSFGRPSSKIASLNVPSRFAATGTSGKKYVFAAPSNTSLQANTTYFIVLYTTGDLEVLSAKFTQTGLEEDGAAAGWSIADSVYWFRTNLPSRRWDTRHYEMQIGVVGPLSSNNNLSDLSVSTSTARDGTFSPLTLTPATFDKETTTYTASVINSVTHAKVTPTLEEADKATVQVGKGTDLSAVQSGMASNAIALDVGKNAINVEVEAEDGSKKTYTVTILRHPAPPAVTVTPGAADGKPTIAVASGTIPNGYIAKIQIKLKSAAWPQRTTAHSLPTGVEAGMSTAGKIVFTGFQQKTDYDVRQHLIVEDTSEIIAESSAAKSTTTWTVPGAPTNVNATPGNAQLVVSWNAPSFTGGTGATITGFKVRWREKDTDANTGGDQPGTWNHDDGTDASSTTGHTIANLELGTTYDAEVRALNGINPGSEWAAVEGTSMGTVRLSATPNPVDEGASVTVTVTLSAATPSTVTIPLTLTAGSAEAGDYGTLSSITISSGATTGTGDISTNEDADTEDETFTVALASNLPAGVVAGNPNSVEITVMDDDLSVALSASTTAVTEGETVTVTATLSAATPSTVAIPLTLTAGSAEAGDYGALASITISSGSTTGTGTISANEDVDTEDETFTVALGSNLPEDVVAGNPNSVEIAIIDNDTNIPTVRLSATPNPVPEGETVTVTATLSAALAIDVTIPLILTAGSAENEDYGALSSITISSGATTGTGDISTSKDADTEDETFTVALGMNLPAAVVAGNPTSVDITVSDNDLSVSIEATPTSVSEGEWTTVTAMLSEQAAKSIKIPLTQIEITAEVGDFEVLPSITVGSGTSSSTATIPAMQDDDTDDETFTVALASTLPDGIIAGSPSSATITIIDDDTVASAVRLSASPNPVDEGKAVTVTATLSAALDSAVKIPLNLTAGSAEEGDYGALESISINAGATSGTGTIKTSQDADSEDETFTVALGNNLPTALSLGNPNSVEITIADIDVDVSISAAPNPVDEGETVTVTATLSAALDRAVTIPLRLTAGSAEEGDYGMLESISINAGATSGAGMIETSQDDDSDDETFTVALGSNLPAGIIAGNSQSIEVMIIDDDEDIQPQAWLARFGRTVAGQAVDAVESRLSQPRAPGGRAMLAGEALPSWPPPSPMEVWKLNRQTQPMTGRWWH